MALKPLHQQILPKIKDPSDIARLSMSELAQLAEEIREEMIFVVSKNGGHLAPSLGVVELTLALLRVFYPGKDKLIWDVGHQSYAYKLLTGRRDDFHTLRTHKGICGFPRREESPFDHFGTGHSSTSISAALGMAMARDLKGKNHNVLAIIGDGSMTAGIAFEGLNQAGDAGRPLIVVLNDNEMSISKNVGALSLLLSRGLSTKLARRTMGEVENFLSSIPGIGEDIISILHRGQSSIKTFFTPGMLFEALGFDYVGPVDGHDIEKMSEIFEVAKSMSSPVLVHVLTKKGRGYAPAEDNPTRFHGVGKFELKTGESEKIAGTGPTFTECFGETLVELAKKDKNIIAITAAMPGGTGLEQFAKQFPERYVDVGICEQHAVTFAGGLATQGMKPVVAIYSTFMQRAYDQILHDICLQNLPVVLCLDRAGLVGEDGATHHGTFDLSYLRHIPNISLLTPRNGSELKAMLIEAVSHGGPVALRYPRACTEETEELNNPIEWGRGEIIQEGEDIAIIAVGSLVNFAIKAAKSFFEETGRAVTIFNCRFVKPLPHEQISEIVKSHSKLLILEENVLAGGFSGAVLEFLNDRDLGKDLTVSRLGLPDCFVEHGSTSQLLSELHLDASGILAELEKLDAKTK